MRRLDIKRISKEDFDQEDQPLIDKLAYAINSGFEQIQAGLDGQLDFRNLNQQVVTLDVTTDATGVPTILTQWRSTLLTSVLGTQVIAATNQTAPQNMPTGTPFVSFSQINGNQVKVNKITNLQPNERYTLTLIVYGRNLPS
jgi:hypothetical protein